MTDTIIVELSEKSEASAYLRISTGTFQALKNEGKIKPSYTVGSTCFYRAKDLDKQVSNLYEK